ncbi:DUF1365 family protein [Sphingomonas sp. CGMCC 1.13654]|uniref:DUF1365 family protein n=1 Tax=Sphingomonas chungangi TaxID=2683589 RepID=A0A838L112_9SPHN|nr:DUF1365 family protein [Sphingomonas chungangi]MBA2932884.1 DUF1365 family protein [Sphingomonas chungangi]MVW56504.1 DUF1365 family protein [Sphingomonas chungangi]
MTGNSALYVGHVMHRRTRPRSHRLRYRIFSLLLDLDEIDMLAARLMVFSRSRFNLFSFHDRDYAAGTREPLRAQVERHLASAGMDLGGGAIRLLTMPRILGFAFNPLNVYFCHDSGGALRAVLYEVNNTFGQRHSYLLPVEQVAGTVRQGCAKDFHVSPFMGMDMRYAFRLTPPDQRLSLAITGSDGEGPIITAVHSAARRPLTNAQLLRAFATHPLLTFKVVGGILWEALRLWIKGVPVQDRPALPIQPVTIVKTPQEAACI